MNQELLEQICRHVVAMVFTYEVPVESQIAIRQCAIVGFIVEHKGIWLLVTAGHCVEDFERLRTSDGVDILRSGLADALCGEKGASYSHPFDFLGREPAAGIWISETGENESGLDIAVFPLRQCYRNFLTKGGIEPAKLCEAPPDSLEPNVEVGMVGLPEELWQQRADESNPSSPIGVRVVYIPLDLKEPALDTKDFPRICATIREMNNLETPRGMSGGPVLAYVDGKFEVIGIQSKWLPITKEIRACPINQALERALSRPGASALLDSVRPHVAS